MKTIDKINKNANKQIVFLGSDSPHKDIEPLSTGIQALDVATGIGGFPKGRICEIFGLPGVAKTSFALSMIAHQQREGKTCAFVDAECALDMDFAAKLGVNTDDLIIIQGDCGEENFDAIEALLRDGAVDFVVVDSVPSMVPRAEIEADVNKPQMGGQARLIASGLRRIVPLAAKSGAVVLFINQQRINILGGQYNPYTTPGGIALKFYTSMRIELKKGSAISLGSKNIIDGYQIKFLFKKNKVGSPSQEVVADFVFETGFQSTTNLIALCESKKIVTVDRTGGVFYNGTKIGRGRERTNADLESNIELREELLKALNSR